MNWETYLVEHYRPGLPLEDLRRAAGVIRAAVSAMEREGSPVRYLRSTIVPQDEAFLSVFQAASEELVREAYERAGVCFDRISRAIAADG